MVVVEVHQDEQHELQLGQHPLAEFLQCPLHDICSIAATGVDGDAEFSQVNDEVEQLLDQLRRSLRRREEGAGLCEQAERSDAAQLDDM